MSLRRNSMYRIIFCLILNSLSMPLSFALTSRISFGVVSKTCRVELQQRKQGQIQVQQNFIKEECKNAIELCEEWATLHEVEGRCSVNQNQDQFVTTVGCIGECPQTYKPSVPVSKCPTIERFCGKTPRIGSSMEEYMRFRKCVRKIEACENGEINPSDF
jgi:hypothetical protein